MNICKKQITINDVKQAAARIGPFIHRTPIMTCKYFNELSSKTLHFKCENFQRTGAFKIRGATNGVMKQVERKSGEEKPVVVTHSSGNHAQATALAAKLNGIAAHVVMPNTAPQVKKNAVKGFGASIVESEPSQEHREMTAQKVIDDVGKNAFLLSSSNNEDVIAGQGTMALEILDEIPDLEALVVPVSGGGMLSGICVAAKGINPDIKIFAAEPKNADDCARSFAAKKLLRNASPPDTVADGLKMNVGEIAWPIIRDSITDVIVVEEEDIISAMKLVYERMKIVIEPSSAVAVAATLSDKFKNDYKSINKVCVILSGGNVDMDNLPWIK
eukprot:gene9816-10823_t